MGRDDAEAVGPDDAQALVAHGAGKTAARLLIAVALQRRDDDGRRDAEPCRLLDQSRHRRAGRRDDREVRRCGEIGEPRMGFHASDDPMLRVDGVEGSGKARPGHVGHQRLTHRMRPVRRPDNGDRARGEEPVEAVKRHGTWSPSGDRAEAVRHSRTRAAPSEPENRRTLPSTASRGDDMDQCCIAQQGLMTAGCARRPRLSRRASPGNPRPAGCGNPSGPAAAARAPSPTRRAP